MYLALSCEPPVLNWAKLTGFDQIQFYPTLWSQLGHYECVLSLSDSINATSYKFLVDVQNFPPQFANSEKPQNVRVKINQESEVELPTIVDTENNPVNVIQ